MATVAALSTESLTEQVIYNLHYFTVTSGDGPSFDANPPDTDIHWILQDMVCIYGLSSLPPGYLAISPNPNDCSSSSENGFTDKQCGHLQSIINILNMLYTYWFNQDTGEWYNVSNETSYYDWVDPVGIVQVNMNQDVESISMI